MRKRISILLYLVMTLVLSACGNSGSGNRPSGQAAGVNEVLEAGIAEAEGKNDVSDSQAVESKAAGSEAEGSQTVESADAVSAFADTMSDLSDEQHPNGVNEGAPAPESADEAEVLSSTEGIDVDLTALSSTMVYSEVYNMLVSPDDYIGKVVRMHGRFAGYHDEKTDKYYFACIIQDATACCSRGIEFILTDDYIYPDDYPQEGEEITVIGTFDTYYENKVRFCTLKNSVLV